MTNQQQLLQLTSAVNTSFQHLLVTMELGSDRQFRMAREQWEEAEKALRDFREQFVFSGAGIHQQWNQPSF